MIFNQYTRHFLRVVLKNFHSWNWEFFGGLYGTFYYLQELSEEELYDCLDCYYQLLIFLSKNERMNNER